MDVNDSVRVLRILALGSETGGLASAGFESVRAIARYQHASIAQAVLTVAPLADDVYSSRVAELRALGVEVVEMRSGRFPEWLVPGLGARGMALRAIPRADVVHCEPIWTLPALGCLFARAIGWRRPVVVSPHEGLTAFDVSKARNPLLRLLKRLMARLANSASVLVFASNLERDDAAQPTLCRTRVVYHAVLPPGRTSQGGRRDSLGFMGRFDRKKGLERLLEGFAIARDNSWLPPVARLRLAGSGDPKYEQALRDLARRLEIADSVDWLGWVRADDRGEFFEELTALVMPSDYECFGLVAAEAALQQVATVVSDRTGVAELLRRVSPESVVDRTPRAVARALRDVYLWDDRRRGEVASALTAHLAPEVHARSLAGLYRLVVAGTR